MKLFLDDYRSCPKGRIKVSTYKGCIDILKNNRIEELSLDHDLGEAKTGYDVICWIETADVQHPGGLWD